MTNPHSIKTTLISAVELLKTDGSGVGGATLVAASSVCKMILFVHQSTQTVGKLRLRHPTKMMLRQSWINTFGHRLCKKYPLHCFDLVMFTCQTS